MDTFPILFAPLISTVPPIIGHQEKNNLAAISAVYQDDGEKGSFTTHHVIRCNVQIEGTIS